MASGQFNRRQVVTAFAASGLLPTLAASAATQTPKLVRGWASGNSTLTPLAVMNGQIFFSGDKTLGRIDPAIATRFGTCPTS